MPRPKGSKNHKTLEREKLMLEGRRANKKVDVVNEPSKIKNGIMKFEDVKTKADLEFNSLLKLLYLSSGKQIFSSIVS